MIRRTNTRPPQLRQDSPWGIIDHIYDGIAPGVVSVNTPSHGGLWIAPELEALIPATCQAIARQYAPAGWYEEDCDCAIPLALLPGIPKETRAEAIDSLYRGMPRRMAPVRAAVERMRGRIEAES